MNKSSERHAARPIAPRANGDGYWLQPFWHRSSPTLTSRWSMLLACYLEGSSDLRCRHPVGDQRVHVVPRCIPIGRRRCRRCARPPPRLRHRHCCFRHCLRMVRAFSQRDPIDYCSGDTRYRCRASDPVVASENSIHLTRSHRRIRT
jgi:hypothetical protein